MPKPRLIDANKLRPLLLFFQERDALGRTPLQICDAMPTVRAPKPEKTEHKSLRELRQAKGLSQSELAKLAGMSVRSLQGYERQGRDLNLAAGATLYRIARALDVRVEDLLDTDRID